MANETSRINQNEFLAAYENVVKITEETERIILGKKGVV